MLLGKVTPRSIELEPLTLTIAAYVGRLLDDDTLAIFRWATICFSDLWNAAAPLI